VGAASTLESVVAPSPAGGVIASDVATAVGPFAVGDVPAAAAATIPPPRSVVEPEPAWTPAEGELVFASAGPVAAVGAAGEMPTTTGGVAVTFADAFADPMVDELEVLVVAALCWLIICGEVATVAATTALVEVGEVSLAIVVGC
jgi:hypothetical protein